MEQTLKGQVAVITGASGGLGAHFARVLAKAGASVALTARRLDLVESHAGAIAGAGGQAMALKLDIADAAAIGPAFDEVEAALGPISILINNAGVGGEGLALDLSIEDWDRTFDVNVRGVFFAAQQAAKRMIASGVAERGDARIVNIASIAGKEGNPNASAYSASKAAVIALTKSLGKELADKDVAVNCITPAAARTRIFDQMSEEHIGYMLAKIPRGRFLLPDEVASMVAFLASAENSFTTAGVFDLSGGRATY